SAVDLTVVELGIWHEILDAADGQVYNLTGVSVTDDEVSPVAIVENEDYILDAVHGQILFFGDGPGLIVPTDVVEITATIPADTILQVEGGTQPQQKRHIWFKGDPAEGVVQQIQGWGLFIPSGDLSLIGDDWENFTLEGNWLAHSLYGKLGFKYKQLGVRA
ncbi:hypothetical protein LCGC14_3062160, partial [marine sediment metagenome]